MAPVKISFSDHTLTPPVFVAGSFTDWKAVEIEFTTTQDAQGQTQHIYEKIFDLGPGEHQYKFRLGSGDWWVCDTQAPHTRDDAGNENNFIVVEPEVKKAPLSTTSNTVVNGTTSKPEEPYVNGVSRLEVEYRAQAHQQTTLAPTPVFENTVAARKVEDTTVAEPTSANQKIEAVEPEKPVEKANGQQVVSADVAKETNIPEAQSKAQHIVNQSASNTTDGPASPQPATKEAISKKSSDSSVAPKEKLPQKTEDEPEKVGCFSRFFLCGSSRK